MPSYWKIVSCFTPHILMFFSLLVKQGLEGHTIEDGWIVSIHGRVRRLTCWAVEGWIDIGYRLDESDI